MNQTTQVALYVSWSPTINLSLSGTRSSSFQHKIYAITSRNSWTTLRIQSSAANTMQNKATNTPAASITHNNTGMETLFDMQITITVSRNVLFELYTCTLSYKANDLLGNCWWIMRRQWDKHFWILNTDLYQSRTAAFAVPHAKNIYNRFRVTCLDSRCYS